MLSHLTRSVLFLVLVAVARSAEPSRPADARPNIVFILADDLGWADTTLNGHTKYYQTPNLARLAKRGMTFSRAYSASPMCPPCNGS